MLTTTFADPSAPLSSTLTWINQACWGLEKGSRPEVMCATEEGLGPERLFGPTKRSQTVGPIDECLLEELALNQEAAAKLWALSEEKTSLSWSP